MNHLPKIDRRSFVVGAAAAAGSLSVGFHVPDAAAAGFVPLASMLPRLSSVILTLDGARRASHGLDLGPDDLTSRGGAAEVSAPPESSAASEADGWIRLLAPEGDLVGLARPMAGSGLLHPSVVLI